MDKSRRITLEKPRYRIDGLQQRIPDGVEKREIFCQVKSITRAEWSAAALKGLKSAYCVTVWADEYQNEEVAILDGVRYVIYRTYCPNSEEMELYLDRSADIR